MAILGKNKKGNVVLRLLTVKCTEIDCYIFFYHVTLSVDVYICPQYIVNILMFRSASLFNVAYRFRACTDVFFCLWKM